MSSIIPVEFDGNRLQLIDVEGEPFVALRPICDALGLSWSPQTDKFRTYEQRWRCAVISTVAEDGKVREMWTMPLKKLPAYLYSISPGKVAEAVRPKLERYQAECDEVLWQHWAQVHGVQNVDGIDPARVERLESVVIQLAEQVGRAVEFQQQHIATLGKVDSLQDKLIHALESQVRYLARPGARPGARATGTRPAARWWTEEETQTLLRLQAEGLGWDEISRQLGRSRESVRWRSYRLQGAAA